MKRPRAAGRPSYLLHPSHSICDICRKLSISKCAAMRSSEKHSSAAPAGRFSKTAVRPDGGGAPGRRRSPLQPAIEDDLSGAPGMCYAIRTALFGKNHMKRRVYFISVLAELAALAATAFDAGAASFYVGGGSGAALQSAINAASAGDTILVGPGSYSVYMGFQISRSLHVIAEKGPSATVIANFSGSRGAGSPDYGSAGFTITGAAEGFTIRGFTFRDHYKGDYEGGMWGGWGVYAMHSAGVIEGNVFERNGAAVFVMRDSRVFVRDNLMKQNGQGVQLSEAAVGEVRFNTIAGSYVAIWVGHFAAPTDVSIRNNIFSDCGYGVRNATEGLSSVSVACNDFWSCEIDCAGLSGSCVDVDGNISADPFFCDGYYLHLGSPCLGAGAPASCGGEHMGCYPTACELGAEKTSWGAVKSLFR